MRPLAIDLYAGLGGWSDGLLSEGWDVIGFDIERHVYGDHRYPAQLVIQDVLTLHGSQFRNVDLIVASPPCQFFSYTAMPWTRAKKLAAEVRADPVWLEKELALFNACFRIQREACEAAGRHIPMVVENVRGAIPWVRRSRWNFGSYHLWGDVPALMPVTVRASKFGQCNGEIFNDRPKGNVAAHREGQKNPGFRFQSESVSQHTPREGYKAAGMNWSDRSKRGQDFTRIAGAQNDIKCIPHRTAGHWTNPAEHEGVKNGNDWFGSGDNCSLQRHAGSKSSALKAASAMIAKIPEPLARHIARTFKPETAMAGAA